MVPAASTLAPLVTDTSTPETTRQPPSRRAVTIVGSLLAVMVVMSYVGDLMTTTWSNTHPAWLLSLNARNRILALVTNSLDAPTYYGIGMTRLLLSDPLFFLLGHWYGDAAIVWMEKRTKTWGQMLRQLEGWFGKAAYPLVFIAPNNPICLFAGAAGMPIRAFLALNVAGTVVRLYVIRRVGETFEAPIDNVLDWFADYRAPLFVVSLVLLVISIALEARKGETELTAYSHLDDELEGAEADSESKSKSEPAKPDER